MLARSHRCLVQLKQSAIAGSLWRIEKISVDIEPLQDSLVSDDGVGRVDEELHVDQSRSFDGLQLRHALLGCGARLLREFDRFGVVVKAAPVVHGLLQLTERGGRNKMQTDTVT